MEDLKHLSLNRETLMPLDQALITQVDAGNAAPTPATMTLQCVIVKSGPQSAVCPTITGYSIDKACGGTKGGVCVVDVE
jgi:hypothetical protein